MLNTVTRHIELNFSMCRLQHAVVKTVTITAREFGEFVTCNGSPFGEVVHAIV
jgi:hypothetical protein